MLVGSGVKGKGGTLLLYSSNSLLEGALLLLSPAQPEQPDMP
jgi:hypothetical protein